MKRPPLIIHTDWSRDWGGQEMRILTELTQMQALGFNTALLVPEDAELARRARDQGIPVHAVPFASKFHLPSWKLLLKTLRRLRPAVVNTHSSEDSWMAASVARLQGVPLVTRTRHVLASISSSVSYNLFPHVIFACSQAIADQLAREGVHKDKIVVQPTGIDADRFRFSANDRQQVRRRYQLADSDILVGNVAFIRHYKGHDFIVRTAARMPASFKFMIVGGGRDLPLLRETIARAGVADRFILTGHREDPERYFSAFDILFFSSYEAEGISQAFIQGLLYGLPLLVCRTPSIMEPLVHVSPYELIDYADLDAACHGLNRLAAQRQRNPDQVNRQRRAIRGQYGLEAMMANILRVYKQYGIIPPVQ